MKYLPYREDLKEKARDLRRNATPAERKLWLRVLSRKQLGGCRFLRQKPIANFIVDFYCAKLKLAIEIDGDSHAAQETYDKQRTRKLNELGIQVLRYTNAEILQNLAGVHEDLCNHIKGST